MAHLGPIVNGGRRPITDAERPHLVAMGARLRAHRVDAGLTLAAVGTMASLSPGHLSAVERALRRTRRSTLERVVVALAAEEHRGEVLAELVDLAGPGLAPESMFAERVARRRERRERHYRPLAIREIAELERSLRRSPRTTPETLARLAEARERLQGTSDGTTGATGDARTSGGAGS